MQSSQDFLNRLAVMSVSPQSSCTGNMDAFKQENQDLLNWANVQKFCIAATLQA